VTLYEAGRRVGGQVLLAEKLPGRAEFGGVVTNLAGEAERAGVRIVTHVPVDAHLVRREAPDVLVVATGARPRRPPLERSMIRSSRCLGDPQEHRPGRARHGGWADWIGLGLRGPGGHARRRADRTRLPAPAMRPRRDAHGDGAARRAAAMTRAAACRRLPSTS
jgi:NADPH-dependent 2,4-dienoyl-CoA reductase/sulfur reductase-like enzyme